MKSALEDAPSLESQAAAKVRTRLYEQQVSIEFNCFFFNLLASQN